MPLTLRCPRCGELRFLADDAAEDTVLCTGCGVTLKVPRRAVEPAPAATAPAPQHTASPPSLYDEVNPFADVAPTAGGRPVETQNPYQAPVTTEYSTSPSGRLRYGRRDPRLASIGKRFVGYILDSVFLFGIPGLLAVAVAPVAGNEDIVLLLVLLGMAFMTLIHCVLVSTRGQSIAKMLLGMQIVKTSDDQLPGFVHGILLRAFVPAILSQLPFVGGFFALADALYIFAGDERQCLHDKIASTKVLDCKLIEAYAHRYDAPGEKLATAHWGV